MYWYGDHMNGWGYGLVAVSMVAFWGLLIVGIVLLARYLSRGDRQDRSPRSRPTAEQVLAERYARGEIDEDEYRRRLDVLTGAGGPRSSR
jgi:putative membrane protein